MVETTYEHILLKDDQTPIIANTNTKVVEIVLDKLAYGWSAEELHWQHPHLSLGQIYSALAYYWDHKQMLDSDIQRRLDTAEAIEKRSTPSRLKENIQNWKLLNGNKIIYGS